MLSTAGFKEVFSMEGGIRAWDGLTATGAPDAGMARFPEDAPVEELIALAWSLEEGSRKFYTELPALLIDRDAVELFQDLVIAEEHHQSALVDLHQKLTNRAAALDGSLSPEDIMEGGMSISSALDWVRGKGLTDVLDLAISLETNSYDLYIKMVRRGSDEKTKELFSLLSASEKEHLKRLAGLLDRKI
jgi:sulfur-carrier protein adenylyltransferase/sulfurtransferase